MIEELVPGEGNDMFFDNVFSQSAWSAPVYSSPETVEQCLDGLELMGRTVASLRMIGPSRSHSVDWIEQRAYSELRSLKEKERALRSEFSNIPPSLSFPRSVYVGEPFIIEFDDGGAFEVFTPSPAEYRFGMNLIPSKIRSADRSENIDAVALFSPFINKTVVDIEIRRDGRELDPFTRQAISGRADDELVSSIVLRLRDNTGICIKSRMELCEISCVDKRNRIMTVPFCELKNMLCGTVDNVI